MKRKSTGRAGVRKTRLASFVVTAHFKNGKSIPIPVKGAKGKDAAVKMIKKNSPSARITTRKA